VLLAQTFRRLLIFGIIRSRGIIVFMMRLSTGLKRGETMSRTQGMWNRVLNIALVVAITAVTVIYLIGSVK
jgi:hypothetical protein